MRRIEVDSTSIAAIGYDSRRRILEIVFRQSGRVYRYLDVPSEEHAAFVAAESKGLYLNQILKRRGYRYVIVEET